MQVLHKLEPCVLTGLFRQQQRVGEEGVLFPHQVTKYVEREILNHRFLMHPHIVQFKEVRTPCAAWP